ncbi:MAG: carboxyl-terminal processing protease [Marivirga sp.]|jgi:carboxyl-terminal processing protease
MILDKKRIAVLLLSLSVLTLFSFRQKLSDRYFDIIKNLDIFTTLYKELNTFYVDEINPTALMGIGIDAMLNSLDPYTNYIPEERIEDYRIMSTGQYGGIGTAVGRFDDKIVVLMTYEDGPAESAGVKIGDEIVAIDSRGIGDLSTNDINTLLKGQLGTPIAISIRRTGNKEEMTFSMNRERISINSVPFSGMIDVKTAYIRLTEFSHGAGSEIRSALIDLKGQGAEQLILDLRGNPGGLLNEAIDISNIFIPKGKEVVSTKGKIEEWNKTYTSTKNPVDINMPLVILISNGSASASEIVAGVVQDYDRGVLVGQKSFGKGLVQATRPLSYNSQLKLTTAKYYIPSGRCIQAIDYSHRNEDGSVGKIPDSLKSKFETKAGRIVFDGGGVSPDVETEDFKYAPITIQLIQSGFIFNYVTAYYYAHQQEVPDPESYQLSDKVFNDFKNWIKGKDYQYKSDTEVTLEEMVAEARKEKYYGFLKDEITALQKEIAQHKSEDIETFAPEIKKAIKEELMARYHKRQGMIQSSFDTDAEVLKAIEVLNDQQRYQQLLRK